MNKGPFHSDVSVPFPPVSARQKRHKLNVNIVPAHFKLTYKALFSKINKEQIGNRIGMQESSQFVRTSTTPARLRRQAVFGSAWGLLTYTEHLKSPFFGWGEKKSDEFSLYTGSYIYNKKKRKKKGEVDKCLKEKQKSQSHEEKKLKNNSNTRGIFTVILNTSQKKKKI